MLGMEITHIRRVPEEIQFHVPRVKIRALQDHDRLSPLKPTDQVRFDAEFLPLPDRADSRKILSGEFLLCLIGGDEGFLRPSDLCEFFHGIGVILSQDDLDIGIFNDLLLER